MIWHLGCLPGTPCADFFIKDQLILIKDQLILIRDQLILKFEQIFKLRGAMAMLEKKLPPAFDLLFISSSHPIDKSNRKQPLSAPKIRVV